MKTVNCKKCGKLLEDKRFYSSFCSFTCGIKFYKERASIPTEVPPLPPLPIAPSAK